MRSAVIGIGIIFITLFTYIAMYSIMIEASVKDNIATACNEAIYQTETLCKEDTTIVESDEDLQNLFITILKPMITYPQKYTINFYGTNYKEGFLDVGIKTTIMPWSNKYNSSSKYYNQEKEITVRRTMINDEIGNE